MPTAEPVAAETTQKKESGTGAPAEAPVLSVKEKYSKLVEEPVEYKESRVSLRKFIHPQAVEPQATRGGLPRKATGTDGALLLVPVPSRGDKQQFLHRLAAKRFEAMNAKFVRDTGLEPLKMQSGWRNAAFADFPAYHDWCVSKGSKSPYWLGPKWGPGPASLTATYPAKRRPEQVVNGMGKRIATQGKQKGKLIPDSTGACRVAKAFFSPHETGLAMDIWHKTFLQATLATNKRQKLSKAFEWLKKNAHLFGVTPYAKEAWHWEVNMPVEAWITGEDWIEGDDYAVRVKGTGKVGRLPPGFGSAASAVAGQCAARSVIANTKSGPAIDLTTAPVMESQLPGVKSGARFAKGGGERDLSTVDGFIIHETGGGFGQTKSSGEGGKDPMMVATVYKKGGSVHFSISRTGAVKQHWPLERASIASGPVNARTISAELANYVTQSDSEQKRNWANKSEKETAFPILDSGFRRKGHLLNTPAQAEATWQLLQKCKAKLPNFKIAFPCAKKEDGSFRTARGGNYKEPGIIAHIRFKHSDGTFVEYFCVCRSLGISKMDSWYMAAGAAAQFGEMKTAPYPTTALKATLIASGKAALKATREKYFVEKKTKKKEGK